MPNNYVSFDDLPDPPAQNKASYVSFDDLPDPPSASVLGTIQSGLRKVDSYTGAPIRAAIGAAQNAPSPSDIIPNAGSALYNQFGADPGNAPTGKDLMVQAGISPDPILSPGMQKMTAAMWKGSPIGFMANKLMPGSVEGVASASPAGVAGVGADIATNPTSYVPVGEIVGGATKGMGDALGLGADTASDAAAAGASVPPGGANAPGLASRVSGKVAETMTGVNDRMAANYLSNTDRINGIISDYKGPDGYQTAEHAADIRNNWNSTIQDTKQQLNNQISTTLDAAPKGATIPLKPVLDKLDQAKAGLNPSLDADRAAITQINGLQDEVKQAALPGQSELATNPQTLNRLKQIFQDKAKASYAPDGTVFQQAPAVAQASKGAAAIMREGVNAAVPQVALANNGLSALHDVEDSMNSGLLKPDGNPSALTRAGVDPNGTEARSLQKLQDITGYNFNQDAKDFATARTFADPKFTPDFTGKSLFRLALGAGAGKVLSASGVSPEIAYGAGLASTSPAAFKAGANVLNLAGKAASVPLDAAASVPKAAYGAITSAGGQTAMNVGAKGAMAVPAFAENKTPSTGPDAWAQQGIQKLGIQDPVLIQKVLSDPKGKQALIDASDLTPGSTAMKNKMAQIQKGWGQG
jgi:hypothetical protein